MEFKKNNIKNIGLFSFLYYLIICLDKGIKWDNFKVIFFIHFQKNVFVVQKIILE